MGYHKRQIVKGEIGQFSKIKEEFDELSDAHEQNSPILELVELSDLVGAIEHYAMAHWGITLNDIIHMKNLTTAAFLSGKRR